MRCHLDGTELTRDDLVALAVKAGFPESSVTRQVKTWVFAHESRKLRFDMWCRGELLLTSGLRPEARPVTAPAVDWEMVAFLTRT